MSDEPRLEDYKCSGVERRPVADFERWPMSEQEREDALEQAIVYFAGLARTSAYHNDLRSYEWDLMMKRNGQ